MVVHAGRESIEPHTRRSRKTAMTRAKNSCRSEWFLRRWLFAEDKEAKTMETSGRRIVMSKGRGIKAFPRFRTWFIAGVGLMLVGVVYAAVPLELYVGTSNHIGLWNGPATLTART